MVQVQFIFFFNLTLIFKVKLVIFDLICKYLENSGRYGKRYHCY